ncbi:alkaline phosphatase family protein [Sporolactobacillus shoreae]|uniref:Alkaline phosphatase family protein n=1 Tax=Sporolactobacillus shoreae TaxID=1465501 RepID=A0A4Z0GQC7_9BACL|nr:ectonucleotide pyrophosphatase/phosphodiesterase [Sporolactobacillus shoreae]TGA98297.1 alkaline phosphatase family protein [Sporolactobacillus shoreae]
MGNKKHLLMVSLDAVDNSDVDFLMQLPHFSSLCERGTLAREVESVLVSNTYVVHSSIITGRYPNSHGITENLLTQPGKDNPDWHWDSADIKVPTLYEKADEAGLSVCSIFYPVTCGANIRWNFPEVPGKISFLERAVKIFKGGTPGFILSSLLHYGKYLRHISEPYLDNFTTQAACGAIHRNNPDLLLLHLIDVDDHKHRFGPGSPQVHDALRRHDDRLGLLIDAVKNTWPDEEVSFLIFSDHGCLKVHSNFDPNDWLRQYGLIHGAARQPEDFDAFFHNAGGTSFLKIVNSEKKADAVRAVSALLQELPVKRMLTEEEMQISGMAAQFYCGIEASEGYCFGEEEKGQHGYGLLRKNYWPFYLASGSGIAKNKVIKGGCVTDICPLAANILDLPLWAMDGQDRLTGR